MENRIGSQVLINWFVIRDNDWIVKANPEYYGHKPYFQKITFLFLNEDATFAAAEQEKSMLQRFQPPLVGNKYLA